MNNFSFNREPAAISGFIAAVISLVVSFGLHLSGEQIGAIMAVVAAAMALFIRSAVTPVSKLQDNNIDVTTLK